MASGRLKAKVQYTHATYVRDWTQSRRQGAILWFRALGPIHFEKPQDMIRASRVRSKDKTAVHSGSNLSRPSEKNAKEVLDCPRIRVLSKI